MAILCLSLQMTAQDKPTPINEQIVSDISRIAVSYNDRICPINTVAMDFVTKLSGQSSWQGYSADEIFVGWMIYYTEWETQKLIKVERAEVQQILGIDSEWAAVRDFYTSRHEYKLSGMVADSTLSSSVREAIAEVDMKMQMVALFYNSEMLRMFPLQTEGQTKWFTPGSTELPLGTPEAEFQFVNHAMDHLTQYILANDAAGAKHIISKIRLYQEEKAQEQLPARATIEMEVVHNKILSSRWLVCLCLLLSLAFCVAMLMGRNNKYLNVLHTLFLFALFVLLTAIMGMRWWIGHHVPLSNDYEIIMSMAWIILLVGLMFMRKQPVLRALAPILSSLCLLCSAYTISGSQITALMPVLKTPLLFVHVVFVVISYSLFAIIFFISAYSLVLHRRNRMDGFERMTRLSYHLLIPAVITLCLGIVIGSIWAKIAWGTYWSWDPKETWALITLMIYAMPLHRGFMSHFPVKYNLYLLFAFLTVLMTYFGVNYFLPGMHSYA